MTRALAVTLRLMSRDWDLVPPHGHRAEQTEWKLLMNAKFGSTCLDRAYDSILDNPVRRCPSGL